MRSSNGLRNLLLSRSSRLGLLLRLNSNVGSGLLLVRLGSRGGLSRLGSIFLLLTFLGGRSRCNRSSWCSGSCRGGRSLSLLFIRLSGSGSTGRGSSFFLGLLFRNGFAIDGILNFFSTLLFKLVLLLFLALRLGELFELLLFVFGNLLFSLLLIVGELLLVCLLFVFDFIPRVIEDLGSISHSDSLWNGREQILDGVIDIRADLLVSDVRRLSERLLRNLMLNSIPWVIKLLRCIL